MQAGGAGEGELLEHAWSAACACPGTLCVCVSTCVCAQECVHLWGDICVYVRMYISEPALHACETAASLCCGVSQRVQPNEPAQQS